MSTGRGSTGPGLRWRGRLGSEHLALTVLVVLLAAPAVAGAGGEDPARPARPAGTVLIGLTVPDELWIQNHDVTIPLPSLRIAIQVTPRISVDLGVGVMPLEYGSSAALAHLGARWFASDRPVGPYLLARAGGWFNNGDESPRETYPFAVGGGGIEYTRSSGLSLWLELAAGAVWFPERSGGVTDHVVELGIYGSAGIGYRFGR